MVSPAGQAHIPDNATDPATRNQYPVAMSPDFLELVVKLLVLGNRAELILVWRVFLQRPVRRRRDNQVDDSSGIHSSWRASPWCRMWVVFEIRTGADVADATVATTPNDSWADIGLQEAIGTAAALV